MTTNLSVPHKCLVHADAKDPWWYALIRSRLFEGGYERVLRGLFNLRLHGAKTLPRSRPLLLCYNHGSHYDLFFMLAVGAPGAGRNARAGYVAGNLAIPPRRLVAPGVAGRADWALQPTGIPITGLVADHSPSAPRT